jgi:MFS family permease
MVVVAQLSTSDEKGGGGGRNALAGVVAGLGLAVGPLIGGLLTDSIDWRWIFYVNLPLGVLVLVIALTVMRLPHRGHGTASTIRVRPWSRRPPVDCRWSPSGATAGTRGTRRSSSGCAWRARRWPPFSCGARRPRPSRSCR